MNSSFDSSEWGGKGMRAVQAFGIAVNNSSRSRNNEIGQEDIEGIKKWVKEKVDKWNRPPGTIYQKLRIAENADPGLVEQVRTASGGDQRETIITEAKLKLVVDSYPGEKNHAIQRAIMYYSINNRLKMDDITHITQELAVKIEDGVTDEEVERLIKEIASSKPRQVFPKLLDDGFKEDEEDFWDTEPNDDELKEILNGQKTKKKPRLRGVTQRDSGSFGMEGNGRDVKLLQKRIAFLENALEQASANGQGEIEYWWRTSLYLTETEREVLESLCSNESIDDMCERMGMTTLRMGAYFKSAFTKKRMLGPSTMEILDSYFNREEIKRS